MSTAKYLLTLFVVIGLTSAYFGKNLYDSNIALKGKVEQLQRKQRDARQAVDALQQVLTQKGDATALDRALAAAMLEVYNKRVQYRISVSQARIANASAGGGTANVTQFAETVPSTGVKSVKITLAGTYADYEGLQGYLQHLLTANPVAMVYLKVDDSAFEVALRVYGV